MAGNTIRPSAPMASASRAKAAARRVSNSATPAITGTRPATVFTVAASRARFSSASRELFSPTVPMTMRPCTPSRISPSWTVAVESKSIEKSAANCVVAAGITPSQEIDIGFSLQSL